VITPSGVTYERAVLLEHLDKVPLFAMFAFSFLKFLYSVYTEALSCLLCIYICAL
jgi:hypothetical protein